MHRPCRHIPDIRLSWKEPGLWSGAKLSQNDPLSSFVTLDKLHGISESQFLIQKKKKMGANITYFLGLGRSR